MLFFDLGWWQKLHWKCGSYSVVCALIRSFCTLIDAVTALKHWYKEQTMQIKWGKHFSEPFHVSNGVRQGGVLSPYLFAVYLDDLSNELNNIKAGCIGKVLSNHLMFADDICVFCPKCTLVAKNTRCVPGVCRIARDYFQLQQNCLYDVRKAQPLHCWHWVVKT